MPQFLSTLLLTSVLLLSLPDSAAAVLGNPDAPRGGRFTENLGAEPPTLNPITSQDVGAQEVHAYVMSSLLDRNFDTYEWEPSIAEKIDVSKDGKMFTVKLRKGALFSDGKPVTAEDVKFSFDVIFDPAFPTAHLRPFYESIEKAEVIDPSLVRFTTKETYFKNFEVIAGLAIVPKHVYGDPKVGPTLNKTVLGSGPYMLDSYEKGKRIVLKRNANWWGWNDPQHKGAYKFDEIVLRFVKEEQIEIEMLKTGQLDHLVVGPEAFTKKMDGPAFEKNIEKRQVENKEPGPYGFVAWNQKLSIFQEKPVRRALAHLMNRQLMIEKFLFSKSMLATGPWHKASIYASPNVKPIEFDPKKAGELLAASGWKDTDKDGILDKVIDGKKTDFRFTSLSTNKDFEKYLTIYKEDLRKAGIDMEIKMVEWNSFIKLLDSFKFEAVVLGWGSGSVDLDPKSIWHSSSAVPGGSNFISYKNPEVDKLIDEARKQLDRSQRVKTLQKVYELIAEDAPYLFLFNRKYTFYAIQNRVKTPKPTFTYGLGKYFWWAADPKAIQ